MKGLRLLAVTALALGLACAAGKPASASILILVDKPSQTMSVLVDGQLRYRWRVSTGATKYSTPTGSYTAFRLEKMHYSREWDNAGMPNSIFYTTRGHAIHGSDYPMGRPASRGCVRLSLGNAATLFALVSSRPVTSTKVVVRGSDPPGYHAASAITPRGQRATTQRHQGRRNLGLPRSFFPFQF
jgi:hypothetical protein